MGANRSILQNLVRLKPEWGVQTSQYFVLAFTSSVALVGRRWFPASIQVHNCYEHSDHETEAQEARNLSDGFRFFQLRL